MKALLRSPVLHFAVVGVALFALTRVAAESALEPGMDAPGAAASCGDSVPPPSQAPTSACTGAVEVASDDDLLWQVATQSRALTDDKAVRGRLVKLARFLDLADPADEDALEAEARAIDLDRTDRVVRRHVVDTMRLAFARPRPEDVPSDVELRARLERDADRYRAPARIDLSHVYLSRDRRGDAVTNDAQTLRAALRAEHAAPGEAIRRGDPFARGARVSGSAADLDRAFGPGFAAALAELPPGEWTGPVESALGVHVVWIHARTEERLPDVAAVRSRLTHTILRERGEQRLNERLVTLRTTSAGAMP